MLVSGVLHLDPIHWFDPMDLFSSVTCGLQLFDKFFHSALSSCILLQVLLGAYWFFWISIFFFFCFCFLRDPQLLLSIFLINFYRICCQNSNSFWGGCLFLFHKILVLFHGYTIESFYK